MPVPAVVGAAGRASSNADCGAPTWQGRTAKVDQSVARALRRYPGVPAVYGWLRLDRRGRWWLDGEAVTHSRLRDFIARNYARDGWGGWYFQNGPQRAYVALDETPFTLHLPAGRQRLVTHIGEEIERIDGAWLDEHDTLLLLGRCQAGARVGCLEDQSLGRFSEGIEAHHGGLCLRYAGRLLPVGRMTRAQAPWRLGFVREPRPISDRSQAGGVETAHTPDDDP